MKSLTLIFSHSSHLYENLDEEMPFQRTHCPICCLNQFINQLHYRDDCGLDQTAISNLAGDYHIRCEHTRLTRIYQWTNNNNKTNIFIWLWASFSSKRRHFESMDWCKRKIRKEFDTVRVQFSVKYSCILPYEHGVAWRCATTVWAGRTIINRRIVPLLMAPVNVPIFQIHHTDNKRQSI